jgi:hypothetical protein
MALQISLYCLSQLAITKTSAVAVYALLLQCLTGSDAGQILMVAGHHGGLVMGGRP